MGIELDVVARIGEDFAIATAAELLLPIWLEVVGLRISAAEKTALSALPVERVGAEITALMELATSDDNGAVVRDLGGMVVSVLTFWELSLAG